MFLDLLGTNRCEQIELVSCDMAEWIARPIEERCPNATRCLNPYHVVALATAALDDVRRQVWNEAQRGAAAARTRTQGVRSRSGRTRRTSPSDSSSSSHR